MNLSFSPSVSGRYPANGAIWLVQGAGGILISWVYFASEDAKVRVKSLLTQWRSLNFPDTHILISGFNMRTFPLLFVWQPGASVKSISLTSRSSDSTNTDLWTVLVHFMLFVLSLGFIFIEEIEPLSAVWDSKRFSRKFRDVLKFGPRVISICRSCYVFLVLCFTFARQIPFLNHNIFPSPSEKLGYL